MIYPNEISTNNVEEIIRRIYNLNFTALFFVTKNIDGKVFYSSEFAEVVEDKLSLVCKFACRYNLSVYAWFCTFTEGYEGELFGSGTSRILKENPSFAAVNRNGENTLEKPVTCDQGLENYVCPANPKVHEYELKLIKEIVKKYPIKGIHLDFVRYPFPGEYCYCEYCSQKFEQEFKLSEYSEESKKYMLRWKQKNLSKFVNEVNSEIKKMNKFIEVSALVWRYEDCSEKAQDWKEWNIDFFTPMFYHKSYRKGIEWIGEEIKKNKGISNKNIVAAVGGPYSNLFTKKEWNNIEKIVNLSEINGLLLGHYGLLNVIDTLEGNTLSEIKKEIIWKIILLYKRLLFFISWIFPKRFKMKIKSWLRP